MEVPPPNEIPRFVKDEGYANDDPNIMKEVMQYKQLNHFFYLNGLPRIISGDKYRITHKIAQGAQGAVYLAEYVPDEEEKRMNKTKRGESLRDKYVVKMPLRIKWNTVRNLLFEYMLQYEAFSVLKGTCSAPQPLGIMRKANPNPEPGGPAHLYCLVAKFVPLYPGAYSSMILLNAYQRHTTKPLIHIRTWRNICLSLITAFRTLQANDIYHNDVKANNIMLHFFENNVQVVIIDFGLATTGRPHRAVKNDDNTFTLCKKIPDDVREKDRPYLCPALYEQVDPIPTSDLWGVSFLLLRISATLGLTELVHYMQDYRSEDPRESVGFKEFFERVKQILDDDLAGSTKVMITEFEDKADVIEYGLSEGKQYTRHIHSFAS